MLGLLALASAATWWSYRTLLGRDAGVTLIVVLLTLKTLEMRARRDAFVVFFLGFFLILTQFLYSQSLLVAPALLNDCDGSALLNNFGLRCRPSPAVPGEWRVALERRRGPATWRSRAVSVQSGPKVGA